MITILQWNIRGFRSNYHHLRSLIEDTNPACICLQETCLETDPPYVPRGFSMYNINRINSGPHGGSAILVRDEIPHIKLNLVTTLQAVAIKIQLDQLYTICSIYLPPNDPINREEIEEITAQLEEPFLLMGDFNARHPYWGDNTTNRKGRIVERILSSTTMDTMNDGKPTHLHMQTNSLSAIDLTIVSGNAIQHFQWSISRNLYNSDHFPIIMTLQPAVSYLQKPKYIFERANWPQFEILSIIESIAESFPTVNEAISSLTNKIIYAADQSIPKTRGGLRKKYVPWWNPELTIAKSIKDNKLRQYQRSLLNQHKIEYMRARAKFRYLVKTSRQKSWKDFISSINSHTPINKIWKKIDKIRGKFTPPSLPVLKQNNIEITDPTIVGNIFGQSLSDISKGSQHPDFLRIKESSRPPIIEGNDNADYNIPFTMAEYNNAMKLSHNSAAGEDCIHHQMLNHLHKTTTKFILDLFNRIWTTFEFPSQWLTAIVLPFRKPGKDSHDTKNYRPISLTSCLCKLMERMVNTRLVWTLEARRAISPMQYGFRHGRSTTDALVRIDTDIKMAFARKEHTIAVFFDLTKAYDTTWRMTIIKNLITSGITGRMLHFMNNFLSNRSMKVRIGSTISDPHTQHQGVPQGSVLSCTLFSIAINTIVECVPEYTKCSLYVDDIVIYASSRHLPTLERRIQQAVNKLYNWSNRNGFTFSTEKSVVMHFHKHRGMFPEPQITLGTHNLRTVEHTKFLGMIFDRKLSWIPHLKQLKIQCMKSMPLLKKLSRITWGADRKSLFHIYRSLIRSKLDYGCQVYSSATKTSLKMLNTIHHQGIRLCTGAFRTSPIESLYADAGEPPLTTRRDKLSLQLYSRIKSMPSTPTYNSVINHQDEIFANQNYHKTLGYRIRELLNILNQPDINTRKANRYADSPWTNQTKETCPGIIGTPKNRTSHAIMKATFIEHQLQTHSAEIPIYTDGSKSDEGVGYACLLDGRTTQRRLSEICSIFSAELLAIYHVLALLINNENNNFTIYSDSLSAVQAICDKFSNHPIVIDIHIYLRILHRKNKIVSFCWVPAHVGIEGNEIVDQKAQESTQLRTPIAEHQLPAKDFYPFFRKLTYDQWENSWSQVQNNKLRSVKQSTKPWTTSFQTERRKETLLCRLRIGHTRLTHGHLLMGEQPPLCEDCFVYLTIHHILIECPNHLREKQRIFGPIANNLDMKTMLGDSTETVDKLLNYIEAIGMTHQI